MISSPGHNTGNTSHKVVLPFYVYAALAFLFATVLLLFSGDAFTEHHFHPRTMAITHTMALGWGTMIILGAAHQLAPVLTEKKLYSERLGYICFFLAASGIPFLVYAFMELRFDVWAETGGWLINLSILVFLVNLAASIGKGKKNVHAVFMITSLVWLLITTLAGLLLVMNFRMDFLPHASLHYLSLHAHLGMAGWFLLLVIGVGSRLIPMFLISKYQNSKILWLIFGLINMALLVFIWMFFAEVESLFFMIPLLMIVMALVLFGYFCRQAFRQRIRKQVDVPVRISLLAVLLMLMPLLLCALLITSGTQKQLVLAYGFSVFFGWITAIILGMTFKTLPFIVWNKVYQNHLGKGRLPTPRDLFSESLVNYMAVCYISGFILFSTGIITPYNLLLQSGTFFLLAAAVLYNLNLFKMLGHKNQVHE